MFVALALFVALCAAQVSPACQADISATINGTVVLGASIYNATAACSQPNPSSCQSSIGAINTAVANLTATIQQLSKDCFGSSTSPQCSARVNLVIQDFQTLTADAERATTDCAQGASPACVADLEGLTSDIFRIGVDTASAVTICSSPPSSFAKKPISAPLLKLKKQKK